jgi:hypothetical protein
MNDRIRKLAVQAGLKIEYQMINPPKPLQILGSTEQFEKLAELIVKECLNKIENEAAQYAEPVWAFELVNDIKEHFGVEE